MKITALSFKSIRAPNVDSDTTEESFRHSYSMTLGLRQDAIALFFHLLDINAVILSGALRFS